LTRKALERLSEQGLEAERRGLFLEATHEQVDVTGAVAQVRQGALQVGQVR